MRYCTYTSNFNKLSSCITNIQVIEDIRTILVHYPVWSISVVY
jgi:hypothetical protein